MIFDGDAMKILMMMSMIVDVDSADAGCCYRAAAKFADLVDEKLADIADGKFADLVDEKFADIADGKFADIADGKVEGSRPDNKIQSPRSPRSAPIDEGLTRQMS
jgi:hypothetical protein